MNKIEVLNFPSTVEVYRNGHAVVCFPKPYATSEQEAREFWDGVRAAYNRIAADAEAALKASEPTS